MPLSKRLTTYLPFWLIALCAFLIRFVSLNQSLWLDEGVTARVVREYSLTGIINQFSPTDFHPPLYYLLLKLWTSVFGFSEIALRMPSVICILLAGFLVYRLWGKWPALFFLFNPLIMYYSQEARMYALSILLVVFAFFALNKILSKKNQWCTVCIIVLNILITLNLSVFYGSVFFVISLYTYLLFLKKYRLVVALLPGLFLFALLFYPLFSKQLIHSREALTVVTNWKQVLGPANIKNVLLIPLKFAIGRISFYPKWLYWSLAGLWTGFVWLLVIKGIINKQKDTQQQQRLAFFIGAPLALGFFTSFFTPLLQYFRFLYLVPFMSVLLFRGTSTKLVCSILLTGFVLYSCTYLFISDFHRENWRNLAHSLSAKNNIYMILPSSDPLTYYRDDLKLKELRDMVNNPPKGKEIIVIPYVSDVYGFDYARVLGSYHYQKRNARTFRGVVAEKWVLLYN